MTTSLAKGGVRFSDFDTGWRMAKAIVNANMQPKSFGTGQTATSACFVAMQAGAEIGLSPMQAIQNIAVINGKPGIYGPAALALVEGSGLLADSDEGMEGTGDARFARVVLTRVGRKPRSFTFSVADAKRASLWGKTGPWTQYPDRMLLARARGFALRDVFPDVLLGVTHTIEELTEGAAETVTQIPEMDQHEQISATPQPLAALLAGDEETDTDDKEQT